MPGDPQQFRDLISGDSTMRERLARAEAERLEALRMIALLVDKLGGHAVITPRELEQLDSDRTFKVWTDPADRCVHVTLEPQRNVEPAAPTRDDAPDQPSPSQGSPDEHHPRS